MTKGSRFGMISTLSLRNDWGSLPAWLPLSYDWPCSLISEAGGFSSCHIGVRIIFPVIPKGIFQAKKPLFYPRFQSPTFCLIFWRKDGLPKQKNHLKKTSEILSFRNKNHLLGFGSRKSFRTVNHRCRTIFFGFQPAFTLWLTSLIPLHPLFW